eukprot:TRINITY_DN12220_c0_g1_i1.p1 TRINITY_DN12220_c0_g1~~TRINITY_DN12220_c0_g1_i1.p1  ORF type:complete len:191 (+),score=24.48 TRINITY_DN12220_c0_g1_i1:143-715(+)
MLSTLSQFGVSDGAKYLVRALAFSPDHWIVMEYMHGGSTEDFLQRRSEPVDAGTRLRWAFQIASGMSYLHQNGVVHRDLRLANLLLDARGENIKISDFGLALSAKGVSDDALRKFPQLVGQAYVPVSSSTHSFASDIYMFANVLVKLLLCAGDLFVEDPYQSVPWQQLVGPDWIALTDLCREMVTLVSFR